MRRTCTGTPSATRDRPSRAQPGLATCKRADARIVVEGTTGFEPARSGWKPGMPPLHHVPLKAPQGIEPCPPDYETGAPPSALRSHEALAENRTQTSSLPGAVNQLARLPYGRCWTRTSDLPRVKRLRSLCANRPYGHCWTRTSDLPHVKRVRSQLRQAPWSARHGFHMLAGLAPARTVEVEQQGIEP
jgi:hypothetical protein